MLDSYKNASKVLTLVDSFITEFYQNKIKQGFAQWLILLLIVFFTLIVLEYFLYLSSSLKWLILSVSVLAIGVEFYRLIFRFILKKNGKLNPISREEAARLIGSKLPGVEDRLLNGIQLIRSAQQDELAIAALSAKDELVDSVSLSDLFDRKSLLRWFTLSSILLGISVVGISFQPSFISEGTHRLFSVNTVFEKAHPYQFEYSVLEDYEIRKGEDLSIQVRFMGIVPEELYVVNEGSRWRMKRSGNEFSLKLSNLKSSSAFQLNDLEYSFGYKRYSVLQPPTIFKREVFVDVPAHTKLTDFTSTEFENISIPEGSSLRLIVEGENIKSVVDTANRLSFIERVNGYSSDFDLRQDVFTQLRISSDDLDEMTDISFKVLKDEFPVVSIDEENWFPAQGKLLLEGWAKDDYGIQNIQVRYRIQGSEVWKNKTVLSSQANRVTWKEELSVPTGENIEVQVVVTDNDKVNGYKQGFTTLRSFQPELLTSKLEREEKEVNALVDELEQAQKENSKDEELLKKLLNKRRTGESLSWSEQQDLKNLLEQFKDSVESIRKELSEFNKKKTERGEQLEESENQLEKLMDETLQKKLDELEKLLNELERDKLDDEKLEEFSLSKEEFEDQLDRNIELLKRLQVEKAFEGLQDRLEELSKKQEDLSKEDFDSVEDQEKIEDQFEDIQKDLEEAYDKNEDLEKPLDLDSSEEEQKEVSDQMNQSKDELSKGKQNKANDSQKGSSESMKKLAKKLEASMMSSQNSQKQEDIKALRQILDNLIYLSFTQEDLLLKVKDAKRSDPVLNDVKRNQSIVINDFTIVEDSLRALSKRLVQLEPIVMKEVSGIRKEQSRALGSLEERKLRDNLVSTQQAITHINNLAVMLNELSEQLQQQMAQMKFGEGACQNPGSQGKPSAGDMKSMQKKVSDEIKKLQQQMAEEGKSGESGKGGKGGKGKKGANSEKFAKLAAEQAKIREMVQSLQESLNEGSGSNGLNELKKAMEDAEEKLLNKEIDAELMKRQEQILSKLLEAENAERQREKERKRESKEGTNKEIYNKELEEYLKQKERELEQLQLSPAEYRKYYHNKTTEFLQIND